LKQLAARRRVDAAGLRAWASALAGIMLLALSAAPAFALKPIVVSPDQDRIEITTLGDAYEGRGDSLMVETAAAVDGTSGRISVKAATPGTNPNWMVFALTNPTDKPIERWLTADRYTVSGSGIVWPDLDARRIESVTPSIGFVPQRIRSDRADIFSVTLEPGQTITYVAELSSERFARIFLWKPLEYEVKVRDRQLFNGIMLGLAALTAIFLTAIFAANHKLIFPAAALVSWCVLAYLCVDFGFFHKLFNMKPEDNAVYRAAAEASMAASLVMFLHAFLRLGLSHGLVRMLSLVWILAQLSLVAVAAIDPRLAATFARFSFAGIGGVGALLTLYLAIRGQDRALHLVPTWILFLTWIFLAGVTLTGRLGGDAFVSALVAGLVMVVLLIGFTVTQFAFRALEPLSGLSTGDNQLRSIAVDGAGSAVWEWSSRRDEIKTGSIIEEALGLNPGELNVKVEEFLQHVHPSDRERFHLMLWSVQERAGGKIRADFRMRHADNSYRWFELEAASVQTSERRNVRCVGLMREVTDSRMAQERLMHDAVHCSLTGLPNRELLNDRLNVAMLRAKADPKVRPTVFFIDVDKFKAINTSLGLVVGDSILLTVARRLQRHIGPFDTLARIGGDRFAVLFVDEQEPRELAALAERVRRSLRSPIKIASQEIVLTSSLGIAIYDGDEEASGGLLKEAEIAMYRAKRSGPDRIEIFRPEMRADHEARDTVAGQLSRALEQGRIKVLYQPIVSLATVELAGFEATVRWEHPKHGLVKLAQMLDIGDEPELMQKIGSFVLARAVQDATQWQKELPRPEDHLFIGVNVLSRASLRPELVQEVRHLLARSTLAKGSLRLEIAEQILMENPEHAVELLGQLRGAGADIVLDQFGTCFSSLVYVQRMPCDVIKMDQAVVRAAGHGEERGAQLVRAIVAMTHELGLKAVGDGIETPEDATFLRAIGCELGQGFFYGAPMSDREVLDFLRIIRKSERKLQTHGLFKAKQRSAKKRKLAEAEAEAAKVEVAADGSVTAAASGAAGSDDKAADVGEMRRKVADALPNSSVRPRNRVPQTPPAPVSMQKPPEAPAAPPQSLASGPTAPPVRPPVQPPAPVPLMQRTALAAPGPSAPPPQTRSMPVPPPPVAKPGNGSAAPMGPAPAGLMGLTPPLPRPPEKGNVPGNGAPTREPVPPAPQSGIPRTSPPMLPSGQPAMLAPPPAGVREPAPPQPKPNGAPPPLPQPVGPPLATSAPPPSSTHQLGPKPVPPPATRPPMPVAPVAGPPPSPDARINPPAPIAPDFSALPPGIAKSLAALAGGPVKAPPANQDAPKAKQKTGG